MTPTAAEVIDPTCQLQDAPEFWRFTPCNGNKVPIDPGTGCPANDWQLNPYTLTDIATLNGNYPDERSVCKANEYEEEKMYLPCVKSKKIFDQEAAIL